MPPENAAWATVGERRKRVRLPLALTIYLSKQGDPHQYESKTRDISSAGFYCLIPVPIAPGESLDCFIMLPAGERGLNQSLCLQCTAKVVRVESSGLDGRFGVGCHIEEYHVRTLDDVN